MAVTPTPLTKKIRAIAEQLLEERSNLLAQLATIDSILVAARLSGRHTIASTNGHGRDWNHSGIDWAARRAKTEINPRTGKPYKMSAEGRANIAAGQRAKHAPKTDKLARKIAATWKRRKKEEKGHGNTGRKLSSETKQKIRLASLRRWKKQRKLHPNATKLISGVTAK